MAERPAFRSISVAAAEALLKAGGVVTLDVRDRASFLAGHVEGARHIAFSDLSQVINGTSRARPVLIYCYHGFASREFAQVLCDFGFAAVHSMDGGYEAWAAAQARTGAPTPGEAVGRWLAIQGFPENGVNATIENGMTPLMRACREGLEAIVAALIAAGARVDARNADGNTALWLACVGGHLPVIDALVAAGCAIDSRNDNGATSLMYAASAGKAEVVGRLLRHGADTRPETLDGFSALDLASTRECLDLLRLATRAAAPA
ncbi:ankyrin repeat domain-containing protein [Xanthobacter pseudotagetidis]|uniref:ankyrin repeat domain-containing protein n=1 Tax=Xanthobacter pseudotagetidis TaxID=3119911 RepID=UPI0037280BF1